MLKERIIYGALGAILMIGILVFCPQIVVGLGIGVLALIGLGEFYNVVGLLKKKSPSMILGFVFSVLVFILALWTPQNIIEYMLPVVLAFLFLLMIFTVMFHEKNSFSDSALSFFGAIYISIFFLHILLLRQSQNGKFLIWMIFISAWATDTFAYFVGKTLGKHKLCPTISPKKTVEGSVGGVIGCVAAIVLYSYISSGYIGCHVNYVNAVILALVASVVSQFGDLAASCIKREHGAKDYGNLIPGHGGVMDRFDSAIMISPVVYYLLVYLPVYAQ